MEQLWNWLDGRKTYIGSGIYFATTLMNLIVVGEWGCNQPWIIHIINSLDIIGGVILGTGCIHRKMKEGETKP